MTLAEIEALAAGGESETLELKSIHRRTGRGRDMAVCAMLNHRGGTVLFGVQPDRQVSGQPVGNRTIERLVAALTDGRTSPSRTGRSETSMRARSPVPSMRRFAAGGAEEPGTRDPTELLRGFGLIHGDRLLRAAVVAVARGGNANRYSIRGNCLSYSVLFSEQVRNNSFDYI